MLSNNSKKFSKLQKSALSVLLQTNKILYNKFNYTEYELRNDTMDNMTLKEILHFLEKENPSLADKLYEILNDLIDKTISTDILKEKFNIVCSSLKDLVFSDSLNAHAYLDVQLYLQNKLNNLSNKESLQPKTAIVQEKNNTFSPFLLVSLNDDFDFSYTKLIGFYFGDFYAAKSYRRLFIKASALMYKINPSIVKSFTSDEYLSKYFSHSKSLNRDSEFIYRGSGIYAITNHSANRFINILRRCLPKLNIDLSSFKILINNDGKKKVNDTDDDEEPPTIDEPNIITTNSNSTTIETTSIRTSAPTLSTSENSQEISAAVNNSVKLDSPSTKNQNATVSSNDTEISEATADNNLGNISAKIDKDRKRTDCIHYCFEKDFCTKLNAYGCYTSKTCSEFEDKVEQLTQTDKSEKHHETANSITPTNTINNSINQTKEKIIKPTVYRLKQINFCPICKQSLQPKGKTVHFTKNNKLLYIKLLFYVCASCNKTYIRESLFKIFTKDKNIDTMNFYFEKLPINNLLSEKNLIDLTQNKNSNNIKLTETASSRVNNNDVIVDMSKILKKRNKVFKDLNNNEIVLSLDKLPSDYPDREPIRFYIYDNNIFTKNFCNTWTNTSSNHWIELLYCIINYVYDKSLVLFKSLPEETSSLENDVKKFKISFDPKVQKKPMILPMKINEKPLFLEAMLTPNVVLDTIYIILSKYNIPKEHLLIILKKKR